MKKIFILLVAVATVITSCGGSEDGGDKEGKKGGSDVAELDYSDMVQYSLDTFSIPVSVMVPEYEGPMNTVLATTLSEVEEGWLWKISIGEEGAKYSLFIEDVTGYEDDHSVAKKKEELDGMKFMNIKYLVDDSNLIMFEKLYPGDESIPAQYHVMGVVVNGENTYKVYSDETQLFNKPLAEKMMMSIKSMLGAEA